MVTVGSSMETATDDQTTAKQKDAKRALLSWNWSLML